VSARAARLGRLFHGSGFWGSRAAPIFWEVGSWGLWQAAGGCAVPGMGSKERNRAAPRVDAGEPAAVLVCGEAEHELAGDEIPPAAAARAKSPSRTTPGAPRKGDKKTGPRGPRLN
jgi:hypothetical protein